MEREVLVSGVGGQGVQLAAQTVARAAALEGREVTLFGVYGGSMRGGNTDSTVVIGDTPIEAPPIVSHAWSAIVMSLQFWQPGGRSMGMARKLEPGGLVLLNSSLSAEGGPDPERFQVVEVPRATSPLAPGATWADDEPIGAYAKVTDVMRSSPSWRRWRSRFDYRRQHIADNAQMIRAGFELDSLRSVPFWDAPVGSVR